MGAQGIRKGERPAIACGAFVRLRSVEAEYREACRVAEGLRAARNTLVRELLEGGATHAQIADATGLTRGRIGQLASGPREGGAKHESLRFA